MHEDTQDTRIGEPQNVSDDSKVMTPAQKRFYTSEQCEVARQALEELVESPQHNTDSSYFKSSGLGFVDRHLHYLSTHSITNLDGYISNLKLTTSLKRR